MNISQFFIHTVSHLSSLCLFILEIMMSYGTVSNALYDSRQMTSVLFPYPPTLEPHHRKPPNLSGSLCILMKLYWLSPITSLFSICLSRVFRIICSMILPIIDTETDWAVVPQIFLISIFKMEGCVSTFPVTGNFTS